MQSIGHQGKINIKKHENMEQRNGPGDGDTRDNTIKLGKDDIIIGGQANPAVKITQKGK